MNFGVQVKRTRTENDLTQGEFAQELNVTQQVVSRWENGEELPDLEMVMKIAQRFQLSLDQLILGDENLTKKLITDGSKNKKKKGQFILTLFGGVFCAIGIICFVLSSIIGSTVDSQGFVVEPYFFLIPMGYLFIALGAILLLFSIVRMVITKIKGEK